MRCKTMGPLTHSRPHYSRRDLLKSGDITWEQVNGRYYEG